MGCSVFGNTQKNQVYNNIFKKDKSIKITEGQSLKLNRPVSFNHTFTFIMIS